MTKNRVRGVVAMGLLAACLMAAPVQPAGAAAMADEAAAPGLEEIVVTARKRKEKLQDTPISISAYSAERLEAQGVSQTTQLQDFTPNLVFQNTPSNSGVGSSAAVFIRGIGQKDFAPTTDPGVGIYVDGVYLARTVGAVFDMIDIDRVEVLRGPQGTLFGRNTIGGAISIVTAKPDVTFAGKADMTTGTDNRFEVRGTLNLPLTDRLFARISVGTFKQDGYVLRPADGGDLGNKDEQTGRLALRWLATDALEINLSGDFSRDRTNGPPVVVAEVDSPATNPGSIASLANFLAVGNPALCFEAANYNNPACYNQRIAAGSNTNLGTGPSFSDIYTKGSALTVDWSLNEDLSLKSITAWRNVSGTFAQDRDGSPVALNHVLDFYRDTQLSQELQLQGKALERRLNWLAGLYYFREYGGNLNPVQFTPGSIQSGGYFHYDSKAAFAQATYQVTDKFSITPGARYTKENRAYLPDQYFTALPLGPIFNCYVPTEHPCQIGDRVVPYQTVYANTHKFTPYLNLSYKWTPDLMTYAAYSEGFKSGGYTQRIFPPDRSLPSFAPESVKSYELGFKLTSLGGRMRLNGAAYYTDYKDLQLLVADATRVGPYFANAGKAHIEGFELESELAPGGGWHFDVGVGYTLPRYDQLAAGVLASGINLQSDFVLISKWNANASLDKVFGLPGGSSLTPRIDYTWRSRFATNANGVPQPAALPVGFLYQPAYGVLNMSLKWASPSDKYSLSAGVNNVTDEHYRLFGDYQPAFGFTLEAYDRGRQWFAKAAAKF